MWDQRYSTEEYVYGTEPNAFFKEEVEKLPPGRLLLPGEGEGRNAVYAAAKGWEVWAFDQSESGRDKALKLALSRNVAINYHIADLLTEEFPVNYFDAIGLIFIHTSEGDRPGFHRKMVESLKPGGIIILIGYSKEQIRYDSGGPRDESMLFSETDLRKDFQSISINYLKKELLDLTEGQFHQGKASAIQMIAVKQADIIQPK